MTDLDKMEIRDIPMPEPKEKEVLVELEYVGICGSDVHYFHDGRCGSYVVDGDFMLGHECAGTVVELGEGVENLKIGDRVALEPGITCGQCEFCKSGRYNLCPDVQFLATPPVQGCYENYIAFPENMCFKLPDNISTKEGALVEPLSVGMHAANQGNVQLGDSVVILGAGCIGLVTLLACKAHGATDITVVDVIPKRLDYAMKLGATRVINGKEVDAIEEVKKITNGAGAHLECHGSDTQPVAVHSGTGGRGCQRRCFYGQSGGTDEYRVFTFGQTVIASKFVLRAGGKAEQQGDGCGCMDGCSFHDACRLGFVIVSFVIRADRRCRVSTGSRQR